MWGKTDYRDYGLIYQIRSVVLGSVSAFLREGISNERVYVCKRERDREKKSVRDFVPSVCKKVSLHEKLSNRA